MLPLQFPWESVNEWIWKIRVVYICRSHGSKSDIWCFWDTLYIYNIYLIFLHQNQKIPSHLLILLIWFIWAVKFLMFFLCIFFKVMVIFTVFWSGAFIKNSHILWLCSVIQVESRYEDVSEFCESLYAENVRSPYLLAFMIDILENRLETKLCQDAPQTLRWAVQVFTSCC